MATDKKISSKASEAAKRVKQSATAQQVSATHRRARKASPMGRPPRSAKTGPSLSTATPSTAAATTEASRSAASDASPPIIDASGSLFRPGSKGAVIVDLLRREDGATVAEMTEATGWQAHSVRGFLSGSLKKKLRLDVTSSRNADGERRYRIAS